MHPVHLIAAAIDPSDPDRPELDAETRTGVCAVSGVECATVARKDLFGKSFTDGAVLAAPDSDRVGVDAYMALRYKWERMSSWICDGENFRRLNRVGVRDAVFAPSLPTQPWASYATTSYKKHGALRARINNGSRRVWLFESRLVDCSDMNLVMDWWLRLDAALRLGFGRSILETLDCPSAVMGKIGPRAWMEFEAWARQRKNSALYAFLCYLLPSQEELRHEQID